MPVFLFKFFDYEFTPEVTTEQSVSLFQKIDVCVGDVHFVVIS